MEAQQTTTNAAPVKKRNIGKIVLVGLGVAATAVGGFFGLRWFLNKDKGGSDLDLAEESPEPSESPSTSSTSSGSSSSGSTSTKTRQDAFPLKKGSRGERVTALQKMLIAKYGKDILPKYGADGDFGSEMVAALENKNLPTEITQSAYNLFVKGVAPDASSLAKKLYDAANSKSYSTALGLLKQIRNTSDYSSVSDKFKEYRVSGGVRKTLVTGMLDTFTSSSQQEAIRLQFLRMGLKYDGSKWSLSGLSGTEHPLIMTIQPTELYDPKRLVKVKVPAKMVIGYRLKERNGLTLFKTIEKNKKLIVKSSTIINYEKH